MQGMSGGDTSTVCKSNDTISSIPWILNNGWLTMTAGETRHVTYAVSPSTEAKLSDIFYFGFHKQWNI